MEYLSKQKLKDFAKRFGTLKRDEEGQLRNIPLTLEEATQAIERFVSLSHRLDKLKPSFVETRVKVLEICLEEKKPVKRWTKVRDFLVERLESQIVNARFNQPILQNKKVEPRFVLQDLFDPNSLLNWCFKVVILFNVTDDSAALPKDIDITFFSGIGQIFPKYQLMRRGIMLRVYTQNGRVLERYIPSNTKEFYTEFCTQYDVTYSILVDQNSKFHFIRHDEFFDEFSKQHPDLVKTYRLTSSIRPSEILKNFQGDAQRRFLKKFLGVPITESKWEAEGLTATDGTRIAEEYFPNLEEEITSISWEPFPRWKPDNYLFDEDSLRYELADLYLKRFELEEREKILKQNIGNFSIFNLKTFRDLVADWENNKNLANILWTLKTLESYYYRHRRDPKKRENWLEYVRIEKFIQTGYKPMRAYRLVSPGEKERAVQKRYLRQKEEARKLGYDIEDPKHLEKIKREWNIFETEDLVI